MVGMITLGPYRIMMLWAFRIVDYIFELLTLLVSKGEILQLKGEIQQLVYNQLEDGDDSDDSDVGMVREYEDYEYFGVERCETKKTKKRVKINNFAAVLSTDEVDRLCIFKQSHPAQQCKFDSQFLHSLG